MWKWLKEEWVIILLVLWWFVMVTTARAQVIQESTVRWEVYKENAGTQASLLMKAYIVYRGIGKEICHHQAPLVTEATRIERVWFVTPDIKAVPTVFVDRGYPDENSIVCWEIGVQLNDQTYTQRSKRIFKEIISTKESVEGRVE